MDIIILLLLVIGIIFVSISWFKNELHCPPPQIIYRYVPSNTLDVQFSKENLPSNLYNDMFNNDNVWIGGMSISMGKTAGLSIPKTTQVPIDSAYQIKQNQFTPFMSMTNAPIIKNSNTGPSSK